MSEPKPLASLSSGLLARKGQASPAMRRPGLISLVSENDGPLPAAMPEPEPQFVPEMTFDHGDHDDLGWNDMGEDMQNHHAGGHAGLTPMNGHVAPAYDVPEVVRQQHVLAEGIAVAPSRARRPRAAAGSKGKAAFTLRLDSDRHLKLRLVCAINHRSAQQIVTHALDEYLERHPIANEFAAAQAPTAKN